MLVLFVNAKITRRFTKLLVLATVATQLIAAHTATAGSLYLPVHLSPEIEARVERLFIVANMPLIKRPIPVKAVQEAISRASKKDPRLASIVSNYLDRYSASVGITHANIRASAVDGDAVLEPNARGATFESQYEVSASAYWVVNEFVALNVGGFAFDGIEKSDGSRQKDAFAEGSFISLGWDYFQTDIGFRPHWWGPFQDSDMLLSTHASAIPSITFSNVKPLPFFNMSYEIFIGQMSESDSILSAAREERLTGNPRLFGTHLSFNPFPGMAIGFNRILQYGGADRDQSASGLFDAYTNTAKFDNVGIDGRDFGNQASSITARYTFSGERPVSIYMQYAGEDSSLPSDFHLGNSALMLGIHLPKLTNNLDFSFETGEWQNGWYVNTNYGDGLTHYDSVIGHWGGNFKTAERDLGATSYMAKLIWDIRDGHSLTFQHRELDNTTISDSEFESAKITTVEYAKAISNFIGGLKFSTGNDVQGRDFHQISAFFRW